MNQFREMLVRFMRGRYGTDQLYMGMLVLALALMLVNLFSGWSVLTMFTWVLLALMLFRSFSRNIRRRSMENLWFLKLWQPVRNKGGLTVRRVKEFRTHRFRTCPSCRTVLRLPRKRGKHTVVCPKCRNSFKVRILF